MTDRKYYSEEAKQTVQVEKAMLGLSALVTGLGIGGALALLFAPNDGDTMRKRLMAALEDSSEQGKEKLTEVLQSIEEAYPDFTERINQALESLGEGSNEEQKT